MKTFGTYSVEEMTVVFQGWEGSGEVMIHAVEILGVDVNFERLPDEVQDRIMELAEDVEFDPEHYY